MDKMPRRMSRRWIRLVGNIVLRGRHNCPVCGFVVHVADATVILLDRAGERHVDNMGLRHRWCTWSKYRPVLGERDLVLLIETMQQSEFKICRFCKKSWVDFKEFEELVVVQKDGILGSAKYDVAHIVCAPRVTSM